MKNTPYVKEYDANGILLNPITKDQPHINMLPSVRGIGRKRRAFNNRASGKRALSRSHRNTKSAKFSNFNETRPW